MDSDVLLRSVADTCRDIVRDAVNGISVCTSYDEATMIGFMQLQQMLGVRRLMLPLSGKFGVSVMAESVFNCYLNQLEDVKNGSRSLLQTTNILAESQVRSTSTAAV